MKSDHATNTFLTTIAVRTAQPGLLPVILLEFSASLRLILFFHTYSLSTLHVESPNGGNSNSLCMVFVMLPCRLYQHDQKEKENVVTLTHKHHLKKPAPILVLL